MSRAWVAALVLLAAAGTAPWRAHGAVSHVAPTPLPRIADDAALQDAVRVARDRFLARQSFDRFDVTVLAEARDGHWRRGAYHGDALAYPASCVKLAFLAGAIHWCTSQGRAPDCLDADVRPMIERSDNVATGRVVDAISGAPNVAWAAADAVALPSGGALSAAPAATPVPAPPPGFADWLERRRYTERALAERGLLGHQRLLNKTWPTNSGDAPTGFERLALALAGRNAMTPDDAARLMLAIESGAIVPEGREYARSLLRRPRWSSQSAFGGGLPPGTRLDAKIGTAYDTLQEIAWFELPDGRRFVIAAFSNGWRQEEPPPFDVATLGSFVEELLAVLQEHANASGARATGAGSDVHARPWITIARAQPTGDWPRLATRGARNDGTAWSTSRPGASYEWRVAVPRAGRYEIAVWFPAAPEFSAAARYELNDGDVPVWLDQRRWGARWLPLGEVEARDGVVTVRLSSDAEDGLLVAEAIRVSERPPAPSSRAAGGTARRDPARRRAP